MAYETFIPRVEIAKLLEERDKTLYLVQIVQENMRGQLRKRVTVLH